MASVLTIGTCIEKSRFLEGLGEFSDTYSSTVEVFLKAMALDWSLLEQFKVGSFKIKYLLMYFFENCGEKLRSIFIEAVLHIS